MNDRFGENLPARPDFSVHEIFADERTVIFPTRGRFSQIIIVPSMEIFLFSIVVLMFHETVTLM
ncbi:hypothetical protein [Pseudomonas nitroreducens]|uniref:hypothetical protein n=1 Tax=Pseudomonas nitroreducens TaxID=46680 RepID=UPI0011311C50|nr:hypothetical protein [Pseudomonas nitroreducens]